MNTALLAAKPPHPGPSDTTTCTPLVTIPFIGAMVDAVIHRTEARSGNCAVLYQIHVRQRDG